MIKTHGDVKKCEKIIKSLEEMGLPHRIIRNLRNWLREEARKIK